MVITLEELQEKPDISTNITENIGTPVQIARSEVERMTQARQLPKPPGKKPTLEEAQAYLSSLEPECFNRLAIYFYRAFPVINRRMLDPKSNLYIDMFTKDQVDEGIRNYVVRTHGGGKYKIIINDVEKPSVTGTEMSTIMTLFFSIPLDEKMPVLNYKEIDLTAKENMGYIVTLKNQNILDDKGNIMTPQMAGDPSNLAATMGSMFEKFMGMYSQLGKDQQTTIAKILSNDDSKKGGAIETLFLERMKQDDPNKQITMMVSLLTAMKEMMKDNDGENKSILPILIEMMNKSSESIAKSHELQMTMMTKMFELSSANSNKSSGDSFLDSLVKFAAVKEKLPELFGGGAPEGKRQLGEIIVDGIKEIGLPAIGLASQFIQLKTGIAPVFPTTPGQAEAMARNAGMGGTDIRQSQPQPRVLEMPNPNPNNPNPSTPSNQYPPGAVLDLSTTPSTIITDENKLTICQKFLIQYGGLLINAIKGGSDGVTLAENLVAMSSMLGMDHYSILKQQGQIEIVNAMKSVPEFWAQTGGLMGEEKINTIVDEFLRYEEILAEEVGNEPEGKGKGA